MDVIAAVVRPKQNIFNQEYKQKFYEVLLLDLKGNEKNKPFKYLPQILLKSVEDEPRNVIISNLRQLTGGDHGVKGERAIPVLPNRTEYTSGENRDSLARYSLFVVPVSSKDKMSKSFVDKSPSSPVFLSLENIFESMNSGNISFSSPTGTFILVLERWLKEKHKQKLAENVFRSRCDQRIKLSINNPAFLSSSVQSEITHDGTEPDELQMTANEALAKMMSIEKCDIVVMNSLFASGLDYKSKVNMVAENPCWKRGIIPDYSKIQPPSRRNSATDNIRWEERYPVHYCAKIGDALRLKDLLRQGYQASKKDMASWAPLHYAAWHGYAEAALVLLNAGCSPNITNEDEATPLHLASRVGHPQVVEILFRHAETNIYARDSQGKTAMDIIEPHSTKNWSVVRQLLLDASRVRPTEKIEVYFMDGSVKMLNLVAGPQTTVVQLIQQILQVLDMPENPYGSMFALWICSPSLELQLKAEHQPIQQINDWQSRIAKMLIEGDPKKEEPHLKWRRNARISLSLEREGLHPNAIDLLYHEAYQNYIKALYPCKDQDVIEFASILMYMKHGDFENSKAKSFLLSSKNLQKLVPAPILESKNNRSLADKIHARYKKFSSISQRDGRSRSPQGDMSMKMRLKLQFLNVSRNLTVYGSAFFTGYLIGKSSSKPVPCHIGVNDIGIHIINSQTRVMVQSFRYSEIEWKHIMESQIFQIHLTIKSKSDKSPPKAIVTNIRTKQAGLIHNLMNKLATMHGGMEPRYSR